MVNTDALFVQVVDLKTLGKVPNVSRVGILASVSMRVAAGHMMQHVTARKLFPQNPKVLQLPRTEIRIRREVFVFELSRFHEPAWL